LDFGCPDFGGRDFGLKKAAGKPFQPEEKILSIST
jgi:hypothetical protein